MGTIIKNIDDIKNKKDIREELFFSKYSFNDYKKDLGIKDNFKKKFSDFCFASSLCLLNFTNNFPIDNLSNSYDEVISSNDLPENILKRLKMFYSFGLSLLFSKNLLKSNGLKDKKMPLIVESLKNSSFLYFSKFGDVDPKLMGAGAVLGSSITYLSYLSDMSKQALKDSLGYNYLEAKGNVEESRAGNSIFDEDFFNYVRNLENDSGSSLVNILGLNTGFKANLGNISDRLSLYPYSLETLEKRIIGLKKMPIIDSKENLFLEVFDSMFWNYNPEFCCENNERSN